MWFRSFRVKLSRLALSCTESQRNAGGVSQEILRNARDEGSPYCESLLDFRDRPRPDSPNGSSRAVRSARMLTKPPNSMNAVPGRGARAFLVTVIGLILLAVGSHFESLDRPPLSKWSVVLFWVLGGTGLLASWQVWCWV